MLRRKSRSPEENEAGGRKIKTSADDLKLPARAEKFRDFGGFPAMLLNFRLTIRISNDRAEMPATTPRNPQKSAVFSQNFAPAAGSGENPVDVRYFQRFFSGCSRKTPDLANKLIPHERNLFRSLQIDCAGRYLDSPPKIPFAGDRIRKAAGRAKQSMKNLPRGGCRKSCGEDFNFRRLSCFSYMRKVNPQRTPFVTVPRARRM
jgi:hypothetical protein